MNAFKKIIAALLFAASSTSAFAITNAQVFAYAAANYPSFFPGTATSGQYQQYDYRYYAATGNYLAVDSGGTIFVLGPVSGGAIISVGAASSYAGAIATWEASGSTTNTSTSGTSSANPFGNSTWSGTATASAASTPNDCISGTWTLSIDSSGRLTGSATDKCGDSLDLLGSVEASGTTTFGYTSSSLCSFTGRFLTTPTSSVSGTFSCASLGISGTWAGTASGSSTSANTSTGASTSQTGGIISCQLAGATAYLTQCNTYGSHIATSCPGGTTPVASCTGTHSCASTGSDSSWVTTNYFSGSMLSSLLSTYSSTCTAATGTWR